MRLHTGDPFLQEKLIERLSWVFGGGPPGMGEGRVRDLIGIEDVARRNFAIWKRPKHHEVDSVLPCDGKVEQF